MEFLHSVLMRTMKGKIECATTNAQLVLKHEHTHKHSNTQAQSIQCFSEQKERERKNGNSLNGEGYFSKSHTLIAKYAEI